ncbi:MAG: protein-tyrosine kinase [Acetobacteraceae bacterium]|jgi:protein-tyrosine kinase|nr:protein-tyrosine kinase [Acetobacteraceae bacterium]
MLIPKASHLVERVAERLLRSGALDESAAQLLRQPGGESAADGPSSDQATAEAASNGAATVTLSPVAGPAQRSSLFAPPPSLARPVPPVLRNGLVASPLVAPSAGASPSGKEPPDVIALPQAGDDPGPDASPLASPAILGQQRDFGPMTGQAAVLDRPADVPPAAQPPFGQRGGLADPAAGLLQGPASIDAVSLERAGMVDWSRTRTRISEEFRLVQRQIIRSAFGPGAEPGFSNLLLVTSARPGEGKSFMATNLSGSIARQGDHHVLLVDADSKRDSICYSLGLAQARGLLDLAANPKLDPSPLIVKTPIERLSILPVGRERERSAELFSTKEMTRLIQSLGRRYADRLLILDAPPCLSTSDPAVLSQVVGQILFVVEADRTQRDEIEASLDLIQACPTITMVLNKQQISSRYTFGAYSSYYSS